jgi:integrase
MNISISNNLGLYLRGGRWWCKAKVPAQILRELRKLGLRMEATKEVPELVSGDAQTIVYHNLKTSDAHIAKLKAQVYWGHMAGLHGRVLGYFDEALKGVAIHTPEAYWDENGGEGGRWREPRSEAERAFARRQHLGEVIDNRLGGRPLDDDGNPEVTPDEYRSITDAYRLADQGTPSEPPATLMNQLEGYIQEMTQRGQHKTGLGSKRRYVKRFVAFLNGDLKPEEVTRANVADWVDYLVSSGLSRSTIRDVALSDLSAYFSYLWERGRIPTSNHVFINASRLVPVGHVETSGSDVWTGDDVSESIAILQQHENPWLWRYVAMLAYTGFRDKELGAMELPQVILKGNRLWLDIPTVEKTKRVRGSSQPGIRCIPVHRRLEGVVTWLKDHAKDGYLFPSKKPDEAKRYVTQTTPIKELLLKEGFWTLGSQGTRQYTMRRGCKHSFHGLRKYLKTSMINTGAQELVADRYTGHSIGAVQSVYVKVQDQSLERAVDAVDSHGL